jgi:predicted amidohydrolase YtcJ
MKNIQHIINDLKTRVGFGRSVGALHTFKVSLKVSVVMPGMQDASAHPHFTLYSLTHCTHNPFQSFAIAILIARASTHKHHIITYENRKK